MNHNYNPLSHNRLDGGVTYHRPPQRLPERVTAESHATDVMTDFTKVAAMTIGPCSSLDDANQRMIASGVRLLFVTGPGKTSIENHFDLNEEMIQNLRETGKEELLEELEFERAPVQYFYTRQRQLLGGRGERRRQVLELGQPVRLSRLPPPLRPQLLIKTLRRIAEFLFNVVAIGRRRHVAQG